MHVETHAWKIVVSEHPPSAGYWVISLWGAGLAVWISTVFSYLFPRNLAKLWVEHMDPHKLFILNCLEQQQQQTQKSEADKRRFLWNKGKKQAPVLLGTASEGNGCYSMTDSGPAAVEWPTTFWLDLRLTSWHGAPYLALLKWQRTWDWDRSWALGETYYYSANWTPQWSGAIHTGHSTNIRETSACSWWNRHRPQLDNVQRLRDLEALSPKWNAFIKPLLSRLGELYSRLKTIVRARGSRWFQANRIFQTQ